MSKGYACDQHKWLYLAYKPFVIRRTIVDAKGRILFFIAEFGLHNRYDEMRNTMQTAARRANENATHVTRIPIAAVLQNPHQPRHVFEEDALRALAISIQHLGLLRPIMVRAIAPCQYELVSGEKRLMACKQLGLSHIEAIVVSATDQQASPLFQQTSLFAKQVSPLALVESLQRDDLHYLQEAEGYAAVLACTCMTQEALAARVGKSQSSIANKLRLLRLDAPVRDALWHAELSERHARILLRLPDASLQLKAIEQIKKQKLTIKDSDALIADMLRTPTDFLGTHAPRQKEEPQGPKEQDEKGKADAQQGAHRQPEMRQGSISQIESQLDAEVSLEPSHMSTRRMVTKVRDHRLYINAICDIVHQMQAAGIAVEMVTTEEEENFRLSVMVAKRKG